METLDKAYKLVKGNNGAAGIDGITFEEVERKCAHNFLSEIREELINDTYLPMRNRKVEIPKSNDKMKLLEYLQ
jgi:RNA-directed DNA polymerase